MTLTTDPPTPGRRGPDPLTAIAILCIVAVGVILLFTRFAHADPVAAAPTAALSIDWGAIGGIIGAIAGAIGAIFGGISMALHAIAPRTKTTADDKLVARIDSLHAKVDDGAVTAAAIFGALRALQPPPVVRIPPPTPAPPATPGSGIAAMLAVLLLGCLAVATIPACGGSQSSRSATISSVDGGLQSAVAALGTWEHQRAGSVYATAKAAVDAAPDAAGKLKAKADGHAALEALRARTKPAWDAAGLAFAALDSARALNDDPSIKGAQAALDNAIAAIAALTGGK